MSEGTLLYLIFILLVASGFFSASETALFSINKFHLKKLENTNKKSDKRILKLLSKPRFLLITILMGNTLVNISISSFATLYALKLKQVLGLSLSNSAVITIQIIITTMVILVLGEILPKLFAWAKSYSIAKLSTIPIQIIGFVLWPVLKLLEVFSKIISSQKTDNMQKTITTEEFHSIIQSHNPMHSLEEHEKKILSGLFKLPKAEIREIMVPRVHINAAGETQSIDEVKKLIIESGYSRIPVYRNSIDDIIGIIYAKDILLNPQTESILKVMRPAWFVTENMKIQTLLNQFKSKKTQIAIVVDEYGGTNGLITLEDILEELVGEIQDEYDSEVTPILTKTDNYIITDGMLSIRELNNEMNVEIDPERFDNIADYLLELFNHVPDVNEKTIDENSIEYTILDSNKKKINKIKIQRLKDRDIET